MAYSHQAKEKNIKKQECIPVGCVPSAVLAILWGVFAQGCLSRGYLPKGLSATPCKQSQIPVKTLPYRNYVADDNKQKRTQNKRQTSYKLFTFTFAFVRFEHSLPSALKKTKPGSLLFDNMTTSVVKV